ncbi:polynucleotide phosphorylase/polyadenylase [Anopheles sinensis]|uniref:Polynucleotide phosphorylase/polyadenylase n=1 Tax=Anopheles sinensis TaxID=74873 RepID=A0A084W2T7_ANOSI|nr:polynucleotide phosphorylase/polyadenylase [Anopheles sinensis]
MRVAPVSTGRCRFRGRFGEAFRLNYTLNRQRSIDLIRSDGIELTIGEEDRFGVRFSSDPLPGGNPEYIV